MTTWWTAGQEWLEKRGLAGYRAGLSAHLKAGRVRSTYRWNPPDWHRDAVDALGRNDEECFKAIKLAHL
jgi:hypothetical protein